MYKGVGNRLNKYVKMLTVFISDHWFMGNEFFCLFLIYLNFFKFGIMRNFKSETNYKESQSCPFSSHPLLLSKPPN